jgi:hypothetical protein
MPALDNWTRLAAADRSLRKGGLQPFRKSII